MPSEPNLIASETLDRLGIDPSRSDRRGRSRFVRVRKGLYALHDASVRPADQLVLRAYAVARQSEGVPVFSHCTAAAIWGMPIIGRWPQLVEHITPAGTTGRTPGVRRRRTGHVPRAVERGGLLVTPAARTVVDLARELSLESALAAADFALHEGLCGPPDLQSEVDALARGARGCRLARRVVALADGASESVGESLSRARMFQLGVAKPELQVEFHDADGFIGRSDFWFGEVSLIGEFDGQLKYRVEPGMSPEEAADVVWREKRREDRLRAGGSRSVGRWVWVDALDPARFEKVLRRIGLRTGVFPEWF